MNAREEAGKIYRALPPLKTSKLIFIKGGPNRRREVVGWLKYYGADAVSRLHIGGRWVYEFRKMRSMGGLIKNPPSHRKMRSNPYGLLYRDKVIRVFQHYEELLKYLRETGIPLLRMRELGYRVVRSNPPPRRKIRALKLAGRLAYRIYQHVKSEGYALPIPKRTPALVKKYVKLILDANGIKWSEKNPLRRK